MANLKDIRVRIGSVKTTRQVTSAMKMVSAAKFKKGHDRIIAIRPYVTKLSNIVLDLVNTAGDMYGGLYSQKREVNRVLVVVITSNRGLCGAFNTNVIKQTEKFIKSDLKAQLANRSVDILAIGKQGEKVLRGHGFNIIESHNDLINNLDFDASNIIADDICTKFIDKTYDLVVMIYNEFVNAAVQNVKVHQFLPLEIPLVKNAVKEDFIFEPNIHELIDNVVPKALRTMFYHELLESVAAEHGARMTSMHKATDNATQMLSDLQLQYNKARQSSITNEILEIVGGAEALSGNKSFGISPFFVDPELREIDDEHDEEFLSKR